MNTGNISYEQTQHICGSSIKGDHIHTYAYNNKQLVDMVGGNKLKITINLIIGNTKYNPSYATSTEILQSCIYNYNVKEMSQC